MNPENTVPPLGESPLPDVAPVLPNQIETLCRALAGEKDPTKQQKYWLLLQQSAPSSKALDFALTCLMNPDAPNRGQAVRYLHICFPDRLPGLLEAFSKDPDEDLRYELSEFLRDSDQDAAVGMKIGMLKNASPQREQILLHEIAELGNLFHLEGLQGLDMVAGGNSVFARAAELLTARTGTRAASSGS